MTALATAIGRALAGSGLRHSFGVVGNGNILAVAGLVAGGVRYVPARHEGGAMVMADAYYRTTGEVALCTTTYGPGFTNLATGLADAVKHRSGVLVLCGDAPAGRLRPIDVDQSALAETLGAITVRLDDPATALRESIGALHLARACSCPVVLLLPSDLVSAEVDVADALPPRTAPAEAPRPARRADLETALDVLASARRPLLLAGLGAWRSGAAGVITDLGDQLGALYATTVMADGLFGGNQWSLGIFGGFSSPGARRIIGAADAVVAFGASLNDFTLHGGAILNPDATVVQVDIQDAPTSARTDVGVSGDALAVGSALLGGVVARNLPPSPWRAEVAQALPDIGWEHEAFTDESTADRIDPRTLSLALAPLLPDNRTLVTDGGHFIGWPAMYWPARDPSARVFTGAAFQSIGLGFAGAAGAAVGRADRTTVVAIGDGGALMGLPELETLVRVAESALIVVYDDAAYGAEVHLYGPLGADVSTAVFQDTDFAGIARSLGADAVTVRSPEDLAAVRTWHERGGRGTLLLDCKIVPGVIATYLSDIGGRIRTGAM